MNFVHAAIALLAGMVFVLTVIVGYLYWEVTRTRGLLGELARVVAKHVIPPPAPEPESEDEEEEDEDDRASVPTEKEVEVVDGPKEVDPDDLQGKSVAELRELLNKKGIPFGKRDAKPVLVQLLKATA